MTKNRITMTTINPGVIKTGRAAIELCVAEAIQRRSAGFGSADVFVVEITDADCEYVVDKIDCAYARKPTPAECDELGIPVDYALTADEIAEMAD